MKNTIQLNIGLRTNDGGTLTVPEIAHALRRHGLVLTATRIVTGQWEGKEEQTLAVEAIPALPVCHHECRLAIVSAIGKLARELRQTCIALQWPDGGGELCPPVSGQAFDLAYFHPATAAEVTACDCLSNVIDGCKHLLAVAEDNDDSPAIVKYCKLAHTLSANADNLRAVICPAPAPAVSLSKKAVKEICNAACNFPNGSTKDNLLLTLLSNGIAPEGLLIPGNPEVTSGW